MHPLHHPSAYAGTRVWVKGEGARILVTYGAAHKSWMLPRLRARSDVTVIDAGRFLDAAGVAR